LTTALLFLAVSSATAETTYYRLELLPSGTLVAIGAPVARGTTLLIHGYPDGKLMSLRKSDVRSVTAITAEEAAKPAKSSVTRIADLPMQGGGATTSASTPGSARPPAANASGQGPRIVPTSDGLVITSAPNAAPPPRVVPTGDGVAITLIKPTN
jgi:hypothetical protein